MNLNKELNIARNVIIDSKLLDGIVGAKLTCEIYCYNAIHYPTIFVQIYNRDDLYYFIYSRTVFADFWGNKSISQTFEETQKASLHCANVGNFVCGMKVLPPDDVILCNIISILPNKTEHAIRFEVVLDGRFTYIKNTKEETPAEMSFFDVGDIKNTLLSNSQMEILENMPVLFSEIIK